MLLELPAAARESVRPLFAGFPGLHGCLDAALEGVMGTAYADDAAAPSVARIHLEFHLVAGDPDHALAEEAVRDLATPASIVTTDARWEPLLKRVWGNALQARTRVAFRSGEWSGSRLRGFREGLPNGFSVKRIASTDAPQLADLADSLVYNYPSLEEFVSSGVGFGIAHKGRFVSGCSSFSHSSRSIEFEIQTHPDFRRRGLACAAAAAMIEYCLDHGLEPCWDAHNEMSAALATKLGFIDPTPYTAYEIAT